MGPDEQPKPRPKAQTRPWQARPPAAKRPSKAAHKRPAWRLDLSAFRPPAKEGLDWVKLGFLLLVVPYMLHGMWTPESGNLVNGITFYTHEAGHVVFSPFGRTLTIAGGTLMQLLVPVAFGVSFLRQGSPYSTAVVLLWLAFSFVSASVYAGDAISMELPLSTSWTSGQEEMEANGETGHDWHNLLEDFGLLREGVVAFISGALWWMGQGVFALGVYFGLLTSGVPVPAVWSWAPGRFRA